MSEPSRPPASHSLDPFMAAPTFGNHFVTTENRMESGTGLEPDAHEKATVDTEASFVQFAYPFSFDPESFRRRSDLADSEGSPWRNKAFPTDDLLPHVERFLNADPASAIVRAWNFDNLEDIGLKSSGSTRSLDGARLATLLGANSRTGGDIPFLVDNAVLFLSKTGTGCLVFECSLTERSPAAWQDFIHAFRFIRGNRAGGVLSCTDQEEGLPEAARRGDGPLEDTVAEILSSLALQGEPLAARWRRVVARSAVVTSHRSTRSLEAHLQGVRGRAPVGEGRAKAEESLQEVRKAHDARLRTLTGFGDPPSGVGGAWWEEVYIRDRMIPFVGLYIDGLAGHEDETANLEMLTMMYAVHNMFSAAQYLVPAPEDLRPDHPSLLVYARRQWFLLSKEIVGFFAFDAPSRERSQFFRITMPEHLRNRYSLYSLLALQQRFSLVKLSEEVAAHGSRDMATHDLYGNLMQSHRKLLQITAASLFSEVGQSDHSHAFFARVREVMGIPALQEEVNHEVTEISNFLERRTEEEQRRFLGQLTALAFVVGGSGLLLSWGEVSAASEMFSGDVVLIGSVVLLVLGLLLGWLVLLVVRRS